MTDPQDRPLVTFALFACNQERFIREAVQGAFAQTYEPLEIILSDDGSSDRTYEIMQEMAARYAGPHKVRARRMAKNTGTLNHVIEVAHEAKGKLLVLAAGDDVSYSHRTEVLCRAWQETGAAGLYSRHDVISEDGVRLKGGVISNGGVEVKRWFASTSAVDFVHGATSAYDIAVFEGLRASQVAIFSEDAVLTTIILLRGRTIVAVEDALVAYRQHANAISNRSTNQNNRADIISLEARERTARSSAALCDYVLSLDTWSLMADRERNHVLKSIEASKRFALMKAAMLEPSLSRRLSALASCREFREFRYALPRVFGLEFVVAAKLFRARARRSKA